MPFLLIPEGVGGKNVGQRSKLDVFLIWYPLFYFFIFILIYYFDILLLFFKARSLFELEALLDWLVKASRILLTQHPLYWDYTCATLGTELIIVASTLPSQPCPQPQDILTINKLLAGNMLAFVKSDISTSSKVNFFPSLKSVSMTL